MNADRARDACTEGNFGIVGMHEQAASVGGSLHLTTAPGGGTRIEVVTPAMDAVTHDA